MSVSVAPPSVLGHQRPRIEHRPAEAVSDHGEDVALVAQMAGMVLDEWQEYVLAAATSRRANGQWSAYEVGLEVARQNGKSAIIEARILWGLLLNKTEKTIIYSAHEFKTAVEVFARLEALIMGSPRFAKHVKQIRHGNDDRSIILKNGSRVKFLARSGGSARGFSGDLIIFDEAYALKGVMLAAMKPTMAARSISGQPQIWYVSSAGMHDSDVLNGTRDRALGSSPEPTSHTVLSSEDEPLLLWMEWSAHPDAESDDLEAYRSACPGFGIRISHEFLVNELRAFRSDPDKGEEYYRREYLGIRPRAAGDSALSLKDWQALADADLDPAGPVAFGLDVTPQRDYAAIVAARLLSDGRVWVEIAEHGVGLDWVPARMAELKDAWSPVRIMINAADAAGALVPDLRRAGVPTTQLTARQYAQACGQFLDDINQTRLVHPGLQEEMDNAVAAAQFSWMNESLFRWKRKNVTENISPLCAATLAARGLQYKRNKLATSDGVGGAKKRPRRLAVGY
ncbi:terminase large subunit domain-containing protein [Nesterenkonia sp. K-15-9-6]|uniref:terminase large subunit domain-containing protein n=1 Tax=Nesterenkonia sp. K-15-9-6 TaxID=3093918 RepID=UPI004044C247